MPSKLRMNERMRESTKRIKKIPIRMVTLDDAIVESPYEDRVISI